jgi:transcriptional regulator with GAF, ATPase, and Fis domain
MIHSSSKLQVIPTTTGVQAAAVSETKLVEKLLNQGLLDAQELELARHYQNRMALKGRILPLPQTLVDLGLVERSTLDQILAEERSKAEAETEDQTSQIEELVRTRTEELQSNYDLLHVATEITNRIISSPSLYELYQRASSLIVDHYGYELAAFFTPSQDGKALHLEQHSLADGIEGIKRDLTIALDSTNGVTAAYRNRKVLVIPHYEVQVPQQPEYILAITRAEINIPVACNEEILAIFNAQSSQAGAFEHEAVKRLQIIIASIAPVIQYLHTINSSKEILGKLSTLYQASQGLSQAKNCEDVYRQVLKFLKPLPLNSLVLSVQDNHWQPVSSNDRMADQDRLILALESNQVTPEELEGELILNEYLLLSRDSSPAGLTHAIQSIISSLDLPAAAIIPMRTDHQLASLIFIYAENSNDIDEYSLQYCVSLVDLASNYLQRAKSLEIIERRLDRLEVLDSISQAISYETDIEKLYKVIHEQITGVMGDVNLIIATYEKETNTIEIPYAFEENHVISIPPFELGDGLTSILIKTRKPLLLVEDTERKAMELGAKVVGAPAKSWLGVPLLLGGEPIGAIIVQDLENEHRFDEEDQKVLTSIASPVAVTLRNVRLIHNASTKASFEKEAIEISNMLWSAADVDSIMQTALEQLGKKLHASKGVIQLEMNSRNEEPGLPSEVALS